MAILLSAAMLVPNTGAVPVYAATDEVVDEVTLETELDSVEDETESVEEEPESTEETESLEGSEDGAENSEEELESESLLDKTEEETEGTEESLESNKDESGSIEDESGSVEDESSSVEDESGRLEDAESESEAPADDMFEDVADIPLQNGLVAVDEPLALEEELKSQMDDVQDVTQDVEDVLGSLDDLTQKEQLELKVFKRVLDKGNKLNKVGFAAQSLSDIKTDLERQVFEFIKALSQTDYNELVNSSDSWELVDNLLMDISERSDSLMDLVENRRYISELGKCIFIPCESDIVSIDLDNFSGSILKYKDSYVVITSDSESEYTITVNAGLDTEKQYTLNSISDKLKDEFNDIVDKVLDEYGHRPAVQVVEKNIDTPVYKLGDVLVSDFEAIKKIVETDFVELGGAEKATIRVYGTCEGGDIIRINGAATNQFEAYDRTGEHRYVYTFSNVIEGNPDDFVISKESIENTPLTDWDDLMLYPGDCTVKVDGIKRNANSLLNVVYFADGETIELEIEVDGNTYIYSIDLKSRVEAEAVQDQECAYINKTKNTIKFYGSGAVLNKNFECIGETYDSIPLAGYVDGDVFYVVGKYEVNSYILGGAVQEEKPELPVSLEELNKLTASDMIYFSEFNSAPRDTGNDMPWQNGTYEMVGFVYGDYGNWVEKATDSSQNVLEIYRNNMTGEVDRYVFVKASDKWSEISSDNGRVESLAVSGDTFVIQGEDIGDFELADWKGLFVSNGLAVKDGSGYKIIQPTLGVEEHYKLPDCVKMTFNNSEIIVKVEDEALAQLVHDNLEARIEENDVSVYGISFLIGTGNMPMSLTKERIDTDIILNFISSNNMLYSKEAAKLVHTIMEQRPLEYASNINDTPYIHIPIPMGLNTRDIPETGNVLCIVNNNVEPVPLEFTGMEMRLDFSSYGDANEIIWGVVYKDYDRREEINMTYVPGHIHYDTNRLTFDTSETLESGDRVYKALYEFKDLWQKPQKPEVRQGSDLLSYSTLNNSNALLYKDGLYYKSDGTVMRLNLQYKADYGYDLEFKSIYKLRYSPFEFNADEKTLTVSKRYLDEIGEEDTFLIAQPLGIVGDDYLTSIPERANYSLQLAPWEGYEDVYLDTMVLLTSAEDITPEKPGTDGEDKPGGDNTGGNEGGTGEDGKPDGNEDGTGGEDKPDKPVEPDGDAGNTGGSTGGHGGNTGGHGGSSSSSGGGHSSSTTTPVRKDDAPNTGGSIITNEDGSKGYILPNGSPAVDMWVKHDGEWYHTDKAGNIKVDWYLDENGDWYMLDYRFTQTYGAAVRGWWKDPQDGKWYYFDPVDCIMWKDWQKIDGKWYYFAPVVEGQNYFGDNESGWVYMTSKRPYGSMYCDEVTPDGKRVDANGARID